MIEWWVLQLDDGWQPRNILKTGIRSYRDAVQEARRFVEGNHFDKIMVIKLTSKIVFEVGFQQIVKMVPKNLEDMVQCPKTK